LHSRYFPQQKDLIAHPDATCLFHKNVHVNDVNQIAPFYAARRRGLNIVRIPVTVTIFNAAQVTDATREQVADYASTFDKGRYIVAGELNDGLLRYVDLYPGMQVTVQNGNKIVEDTATIAPPL